MDEINKLDYKEFIKDMKSELEGITDEIDSLKNRESWLKQAIAFYEEKARTARIPIHVSKGRVADSPEFAVIAKEQEGISHLDAAINFLDARGRECTVNEVVSGLKALGRRLPNTEYAAISKPFLVELERPTSRIYQVQRTQGGSRRVKYGLTKWKKRNPQL